MIKRKAKVHLPKLSDFEPQYISKSNQDTYTLINETFEFLECYFKGSFDWTPNEFPRSFVYISSEGFAFMMKIFFKAVLNRDLIRIKYSAKDNHILVYGGTSYLMMANAIKRLLIIIKI